MATTILSGFPDATTTGVRSGVTLTRYTGPSTITTAGTVIEGKILSGNINVKAANVTFRDCLIDQSSGYWGIINEGGGSNMTVEYCTFEGPGYGATSNAAIWAGSGYTLRFNDIRGYENGIVTGSGAGYIGGNYIHDLESAGGTGPNSSPHYDGISIQGGQNGLVVEWNTIDGRDTSDVFIKNDFGNISNITVKHNLLVGGSAYPIYVYETNGYTTSSVTVQENYVERGVYGYIAYNGSSGSNNITGYSSSGNVLWDAATQANPPPAPSTWALVSGGGGTTPAPAPEPDPVVTPEPDPVVTPESPSVGQVQTGTNGSDNLYGTDGNDVIFGGASMDWLYGRAGNDRLVGQSSNDALFGGPGADIFDYNSPSDSPVGFGQRDLIHDFAKGVDKIDLADIDGVRGSTGNQAFTFLGEGSFSSDTTTPGQLKYRYETVNGADRTLIEATTDRVEGVDIQISLVGKVALSATDFVL